MSLQVHHIYKIILPVLIAISVVSCGGGGGGSTPPPPAKDKITPTVITTNPSSEQVGVQPNSLIEVTFSETIGEVTRNHVSIYPFSQNVADLTKPIIFSSNPFRFNNNTKVLTIEPKQGEIKPGLTYQVRIKDIKDSAGNSMAESCNWIFATDNGSGVTPSIGVGNTDVCSKFPVQGPADAPQNVTAIGGENKITVSWLPANTGGTPTYYIVEKSSDNKQTYSILNTNLPASSVSIIDQNVQVGTSYFYRIAAGNAAGKSEAVVSNAAIPVAPRVVGVPGEPQNVTAVAGKGEITISWREPITVDVPTYYKIEKSADNQQSFVIVNPNIAASKFSLVDADVVVGTSYIYRVIAGNSAGEGVAAISGSVIADPTPLKPDVVLISQFPKTAGGFGATMSYSSNGNELVITEPNADATGNIEAGNAQVYLKTGTLWSLNQVIPGVAAYNRYGSSVAISSDGTTLVVGMQSQGTIYFYTKPNGSSNWVLLQSIRTFAGNNGFGVTVAFSPDSMTLASGDVYARPDGVTANGRVHIMKKTGTTWALTQEFIAPVPGKDNMFGGIVRFSPDGTFLAVGEIDGDLATVSNVGAVYLYTLNAGNWTHSQTLYSQNPATGNRFGIGYGRNSLTFSPDSTILAIGESYGDPVNGVLDSGTVELFTRTGNKWNFSQFIPNNLVGSGFGASLSFSPTGNMLAVGGYYLGMRANGAVQLYKKIGNTWKYSQYLISKNVSATTSYFGAIVLFSPDGSTLAVAETGADTTNATNSGVVNIFNTSAFQ